MGDDENTTTDKEKKSGKERRKWPRLALDLKVRVNFASLQEAMDSRTVNISHGGVFLRMANPRPEGTMIQVEFSIGGRDIKAGGAVVHVVQPGHETKPPGVGVAFTEISDEDRQFLDELVEARVLFDD